MHGHRLTTRLSLLLLPVLIFAYTATASEPGAAADTEPNLGPNLVHNGAFEYVHSDGTVAGWTVQWAWLQAPNAAYSTAEAAHEGDRSLYTAMRSTAVSQGWGGRAYQEIPVSAGRTYEASVSIKMREWQSRVSSEGVGLAVWWQFDDGTWGDTTVITDQLFSGDFDWYRFSARITAPPRAVNVRLGVWANAGEGEIWWDDVQLREVLPEDSGRSEDPATSLQHRLEKVLDAGLARVAEVDWHEIQRLYEQASLAIDTLRAAPSSFTEAAAREAVHDTELALLGSRVAESRAYWIDDQVLRTLRGRKDVADLLDTLQALGINTLYPHVYFDSQTIYPSVYVSRPFPFVSWVEDPLVVIIEEAHARGIEVHAWYSLFVATFEQGNFPTRLLRNPDWLGRAHDNGIYGEAGFIWYDPAHPGVQQFLLTILREGLERYDLDGLHLDYIRYDRDLQYGAATVEGFREASGFDAKAVRPGTSEALAFAAYKQGVITDFVAKVQSLRDEVRPTAYLSAAVAAPYQWAISSRAQDWPEWARLGLIDYLVPMVYTADTGEFADIVDEAIRLISGSVPVEIGIGSYLLRLDQHGEQILVIRAREVMGQALFAAIHLQQIPSIAGELANGVFRRTAVSVRDGERAAEVFLQDMVSRLRDQTSLFTERGSWADALLSVAEAIEKDPRRSLETLGEHPLPQESRDAIRAQLEYALYLRSAALK